jgi:hypothetical protein
MTQEKLSELRKKLNDTELKVYLYLRKLVEESGNRSISFESEPIMKELGISYRTLRKAMVKLEKVLSFKFQPIELIQVRLPLAPAANPPGQPANPLQSGPQSGVVPSQQSGMAPDDRDELPI